MPEIFFCGKCGDEFIPKAFYFAGDRLCEKCRGEIHDDVTKLHRLYGQQSHDYREKTNFASLIANKFPKPKKEYRCDNCNREIDELGLCPHCERKIEIEREKDVERLREAREEYQRRLDELR